jgi:hypothetical protein
VTVPRKNRISYEPFLFALSVIGILYKMYQSLEDHKLRYDWTLAATLAVFTLACGLWLVNTRKNREPSKLLSRIEAGAVTDAKVVGAEASKERDQVDVSVKTRDAQRSTITGYKEK